MSHLNALHLIEALTDLLGAEGDLSERERQMALEQLRMFRMFVADALESIDVDTLLARAAERAGLDEGQSEDVIDAEIDEEDVVPSSAVAVRPKVLDYIEDDGIDEFEPQTVNYEALGCVGRIDISEGGLVDLSIATLVGGRPATLKANAGLRSDNVFINQRDRSIPEVDRVRVDRFVEGLINEARAAYRLRPIKVDTFYSASVGSADW